MTTEAPAKKEPEIKPSTGPESIVEPIEVTRSKEDGANETTTITFAPTAYSRGKKKEAGIMYPSTGEINDDTIGVLKSFLGNEDFYGMLNEAWRIWQQRVYTTVVELTPVGLFKPDVFKEYMQKLSTRGESKDDLIEKLDLVNKKFQELAALLIDPAKASDPNVLLSFSQTALEAKRISAALESKKRIKAAKQEEKESEGEETETK